MSLEVAATLRRLGYRVSVMHQATDAKYFIAYFNDWRNIDAAFGGINQDYPTPGNYFSAALGCENAQYTCDPALDRRMAALTVTSAAAGSNDAWTRFERDVVDRALVVPVYNPKGVNFVSKRLGNYQRHPTFGVLVSQVWVQ